MKSNVRLVAMALLVTLISTSCKEKIKLNLDSASPHMVIEANISDQPGPYNVVLSKSKAYYEDNTFPAVSDAIVTVTDDAGNYDSLKEVTPGVYQTDSTFIGFAGRTYRLKVVSEGQQYDAICYMPFPVAIDSVGAADVPSGFSGELKKRAYCEFTDPGTSVNYYRLGSVQHGITSTSTRALSDRLTNGTVQIVNVPTDTTILAGDTVTVFLESVDKPIFEYFSSLRSNTLSSVSAAPANPTTNITNNALGYFSAYSVKRKTFVAQ